MSRKLKVRGSKGGELPDIFVSQAETGMLGFQGYRILTGHCVPVYRLQYRRRYRQSHLSSLCLLAKSNSYKSF